MAQNSFAIQAAKGVARRTHGRPADQPELGVACGLELRLALLRDALHIAHRDQPVQMIVVVHDEEFVDAEMFCEKLIRPRNRIFTEFFSGDGLNLFTRRQRLNDFLGGVTRLDDVTGKQSQQFTLFIHDGKRAEPEFLFLNEFQYVTDELVGGDLDWILDQTLHVIFHAADFG